MRSSMVFVLTAALSLAFMNQGQAKMVYLHQKGQKRQVALADDHGKLIRLLTPPDLQAYHPEISADGRYVAYSIGTIRSDLVDIAIHVLGQPLRGIHRHQQGPVGHSSVRSLAQNGSPNHKLP